MWGDVVKFGFSIRFQSGTISKHIIHIKIPHIILLLELWFFQARVYSYIFNESQEQMHVLVVFTIFTVSTINSILQAIFLRLICKVA